MGMSYELHGAICLEDLVKRFPTFCGSRRFSTVFTRNHDFSLYWARLLQSMPPIIFLSYNYFNIILKSAPRSFKWSFTLGFTHQNPVCTSSPVPHTCYMPRPSQSSWFDHPNNIWWGSQTMKILSTPHLSLQSPGTSSYLGLNVLLSTPNYVP